MSHFGAFVEHYKEHTRKEFLCISLIRMITTKQKFVLQKEQILLKSEESSDICTFTFKIIYAEIRRNSEALSY